MPRPKRIRTIEEIRRSANERAARWRSRNRERYRQQQREHHWRHRDKIVARKKVYHDGRKPKKAKADKAWRLKNYAKCRAREKAYQIANKEKRRAYEAARRATDPCYLILTRLRARLRSLVRHGRLTSSKGSLRLLGCTLPQFMAHIESKFLPGMSWQNRNLWHIDHLEPCSSYDLSNEIERQRCFHWSNLQPLWRADNIRKLNKRLAQADLPLG